MCLYSGGNVDIDETQVVPIISLLAQWMRMNKGWWRGKGATPSWL